MKLFRKYNRISIPAAILTFLAGSLAFYFSLNYVLLHELDETLIAEQLEITTYVQKHNTLPEVVNTREQHIAFLRPGTCGVTGLHTVRNVYAAEAEDEREVAFFIDAGGARYMAKVSRPLEETEALQQIIIVFAVCMVAAILLVTYLFNRIILRRLWQPFYETIAQLKSYRIDAREGLHASATEIEEFALLNQSIEEMTGRIERDYLSLKNFTAQAAHEMQTPLAIVRTRLDALMQDEQVLEHGARHITDIEMAVLRLSRLHRSLLLLTKVENRQFGFTEAIDITELVRDALAELADIAESRQLRIILNLEPGAVVVFHRQLAEILIGNLLNNAAKYNYPSGKVYVTLKDKVLTVANTSADGELDKSMLFRRFYKGQNSDDGNGLGLSIVKEICDTAGYALRYEYVDELHTFTVDFNK